MSARGPKWQSQMERFLQSATCLSFIWPVNTVNTECVGKVETGAKHQGEQSNIRFFCDFGASSWVAIAPG